MEDKALSALAMIANGSAPVLVLAKLGLSQANFAKSLQDKIETDQKNAARYRYLRAHGKRGHNVRGGDIQVVQWSDRSEGVALYGDKLDAAVDEKMEAK